MLQKLKLYDDNREEKYFCLRAKGKLINFNQISENLSSIYYRIIENACCRLRIDKLKIIHMGLRANSWILQRERKHIEKTVVIANVVYSENKTIGFQRSFCVKKEIIHFSFKFLFFDIVCLSIHFQ